MLKKEVSKVAPGRNHLELGRYAWADARWIVSHGALKSVSPFSLLQTLNFMYRWALEALSSHSADRYMAASTQRVLRHYFVPAPDLGKWIKRYKEWQYFCSYVLLRINNPLLGQGKTRKGHRASEAQSLLRAALQLVPLSSAPGLIRVVKAQSNPLPSHQGVISLLQHCSS